MLKSRDVLPVDSSSAILIGLIFDPESGGPCVVSVIGEDVYDISGTAPTVSSLLERTDLREVLAGAPRDRPWSLDDLLTATENEYDNSLPRLLAPVDLQVIKAAGVTFVDSMLERVIEERAKGDASKASAIREQLIAVVGGAISSVNPAVRAQSGSRKC